MHIITHVRGDPDIVGQMVVSNVCSKLREGNDMGGTTSRVQANIVIVQKRVMLLHVEAIRGIASVARRRHTLHIGFPGTTTCFNLIGQIGSMLKTGGAIVAQTKSVSSGECQVIGKAGMCNSIILCRQSVGTH